LFDLLGFNAMESGDNPIKLNKTNRKEITINTALPSSRTPESHVSGSSEQNNKIFLTKTKQTIPPVVIHY
jgi:hypothetical protein